MYCNWGLFVLSYIKQLDNVRIVYTFYTAILKARYSNHRPTLCVILHHFICVLSFSERSRWKTFTYLFPSSLLSFWPLQLVKEET